MELVFDNTFLKITHVRTGMFAFTPVSNVAYIRGYEMPDLVAVAKEPLAQKVNNKSKKNAPE